MNSKNLVRDKRLSVTVTTEFYNMFTSRAKQFGITYNQLGSICIQAGYSAFIRALFPEEAFTAEKLLEIIKVASVSDIDLEGLEKKLESEVKSG